MKGRQRRRMIEEGNKKRRSEERERDRERKRE